MKGEGSPSNLSSYVRVCLPTTLCTPHCTVDCGDGQQVIFNNWKGQANSAVCNGHSDCNNHRDESGLPCTLRTNLDKAIRHAAAALGV